MMLSYSSRIFEEHSVKSKFEANFTPVLHAWRAENFVYRTKVRESITRI